MSKGAGWDLTSTSSLQGAVGWMLKNAGPDALLAVIIRVDDLAIAADPKLLPREILNIFEDRLPQLHDTLQAERVEHLAKLDRKKAKGNL